jgi:hypothetical protein
MPRRPPSSNNIVLRFIGFSSMRWRPASAPQEEV